VIATAVNRCSVETGLAPDHAGAFETLLMHALAPDTVDMSMVPSLQQAADVPDRLDSKSPIWGVIGKDPRTVSLDGSHALLEIMTDWLSSHIP
jgi:creatinine amidohydrolase